jgi:hypothetical protein
MTDLRYYLGPAEASKGRRRGLRILVASLVGALSRALVSGGGMPMGQVVGATDATGSAPRERRLDPHDILATVYHHLGIDHRRQFPDPTGRPVSLCEGEPIRELV